MGTSAADFKPSPEAVAVIGIDSGSGRTHPPAPRARPQSRLRSHSCPHPGDRPDPPSPGTDLRAVETRVRLCLLGPFGGSPVPFVILGLLFVAIAFVPRWWVSRVMRRHGSEIPGMPGTGGELARHLVGELGLSGVRVEMTPEQGDHYDPATRTVRLSPEVWGRKSLTAVAVAAHEVGHAIQHQQNDPNLLRRTRLVPVVDSLGRLSVFAIGAAPIIGLLARRPVPGILLVAIGVLGLLGRVALHAVTLPTEWDASFGKALPILIRGGYIRSRDRRAVARILRAAAFTYVAAALADVLSLGRWAALIFRR